MLIRQYKPEDCKEMAELFYNTVHTVNAKDYTKEQLHVWAPGHLDLESWNRSFLAHHTVVAVEENRIAGFGDMNETGYLDRLYVHKDYQGRGAATMICDELESAAAEKMLYNACVDYGETFFEKRGYRVVTEQQVERGGILLTNYVMKKAED